MLFHVPASHTGETVPPDPHQRLVLLVISPWPRARDTPAALPVATASRPTHFSKWVFVFTVLVFPRCEFYVRHAAQERSSYVCSSPFCLSAKKASF